MLKYGHLGKMGLGVLLKQDWGADVEEGLGKRTLGARKEGPEGSEQTPK